MSVPSTEGLSVLVPAATAAEARSVIESGLAAHGRREKVIFVSEPFGVPGDATLVEVVVEVIPARFDARRYNAPDAAFPGIDAWMASQKGFVA